MHYKTFVGGGGINVRIPPPTLIVRLWWTYTDHVLSRYTALDTKESARTARGVVADA
jgi:hypothetical protein